MKNRKTLVLFGFLVVVVLLVLAGCGQTATTTAPAAGAAAAPSTASADKAPAAAPVSNLVTQFKASGHANYFSWQLAKGKDGLAAAHYSDSCIGCHSAVKMVDDKDAKLADFLTGGKYAGKDEGISCRVCHTGDGTAKGAWTLKTKGWETCASCHTSGGQPKVGSEVHHPQGEFVKGIAPAGSPLKDMPSFKYGMPGFTCQDCHITNASKHDFLVPGDKTTHDPKDPVTRTDAKLDYTAFEQVFAQDKCKTCHTNAKDMAGKVKQQQDEIGKKLEELKKTYDVWSKKVAAMKPDEQKADPKVKAFQEGATYYSYVEADSSKGVHNYSFAKALLEQAEKSWAALK